MSTYYYVGLIKEIIQKKIQIKKNKSDASIKYHGHNKARLPS